MRLIFDIETDGFLDVMTEVHCLVIFDIDSGQLYSCADQEGYTSIDEGLELLSEADELIGHNIISFDIPALLKIYPKWGYDGVLRDTMNMSRLIYTDMFNLDCTVFRKAFTDKKNKKLMNKHSLESWGLRLGFLKGDYSDWSVWTEEMQKYCEQDVNVNTQLYTKLMEHRYSEQAIKLECDFQAVMARQGRLGVPFDKVAALELKEELEGSIEPLVADILKVIPSWKEHSTFVPKVNNARYGYVKGVPVLKEKTTPFNPRSRTQIVKYFKKKYNWEPTEFTKKGNPKIGAGVLNKLSYPEAKVLSPFLEADKLLSQLSTGKVSWLNCLTDESRLHGYVNTNGARTGRCTHNNPNLAQVPRVGSYKGKESRALFTAPEGMVMVGCDASGIELRNLAHYLHPYDEGKYVKIVSEQDPHTANQLSAGLPTRDNAKTFIYAFNYGAGNKKLGSITHPDATLNKQEIAGAKLREKFLRNNPAINRLIKQVKYVHRKRGYFLGLDGRKLMSVSEHSALNTLLQGAGAIIMKEATVLTWQYITEAGLFDKVFPALNVHDENQVFTRPEYADQTGQIMVQAIIDAGVKYNYNCPLDAEYKVGKNWSETH